MAIRADRLAAVSAIVLLLTFTLLATACGSSGPPEGTIVEGPIELSVSPLYITVRNASSLPLTDVRVSIDSGALAFSANYARLEPGQRRNFSYSELRGRDGTPFNLRFHRPRRIMVTASDARRTAYNAEMPWR